MKDNTIPFVPLKKMQHKKPRKVLAGVVNLPLRVGAVSTILLPNGYTIETLCVIGINEIRPDCISYETTDTVYTVNYGPRPQPSCG